MRFIDKTEKVLKRIFVELGIPPTKYFIGASFQNVCKFGTIKVQFKLQTEWVSSMKYYVLCLKVQTGDQRAHSDHDSAASTDGTGSRCAHNA